MHHPFPYRYKICLLATSCLLSACGPSERPAPVTQSPFEQSTTAPTIDSAPTKSTTTIKPAQGLSPPHTSQVPALESISTPPIVRPPTKPKPLGQLVKEEDIGKFVTALALSQDGSLWIGTEERGVFRRTAPDTLTRYTREDGLGDNAIHSIAHDRLGRTWVGHGRRGVSVHNGRTWKNFSPVDGPLGERVWKIQACPKTGDIWMATSLGLARYREPTSTGSEVNPWSYRTKLDGLPSDQLTSLAITAEGTILVGTDCEGIAIGEPGDDYKTWRIIDGHLSDDKERLSKGVGLPSAQINDLLAAPTGAVYAATSRGLAKTGNGGRTWEFVRGQDYVEKLKSSLDPPPKAWKSPPRQVLDSLLPEDHASCLAIDPSGKLHVGFRHRGYAVIDSASGAMGHVPPKKDDSPHDNVSALLAADEFLAVASYGHGVTIKETKGNPDRPAPLNLASEIPHPKPALAPDEAELLALEAKITALGKIANTPAALYLCDDWSTQGDWVGRIGRQYALLCAMDSPLNHEVGHGFKHYRVFPDVGPLAPKGEALRHWVHWKRTDDPRVLYNPLVGYRREAEWDDHGEVYPMSKEGPNLCIGVEVPEGVHQVSLYFINPNGHESTARFRDYLIDVREAKRTRAAEDLERPVLASARSHDFYHGCYKMFALKGPARYWIHVQKNHSFNTILSGVFFDKLTGPRWETDDWPPSAMGDVRYEPPRILAPPFKRYSDIPAASQTAFRIQELVETKLAEGNTAIAHRAALLLVHRQLRAARYYENSNHLQWTLRLWDDQTREKHDWAMRAGRHSLRRRNPHMSLPLLDGEK